MKNFNEFMTEQKYVDRWLLIKVLLIGIFAGACLMLMFALLGIVKL